MTVFADITKMSTSGLRSMQRSIRDRLYEEDNQDPGREKVYRLRETPDWRSQADEIEKELDRRGEPYDKIPW